MTDQKATQTDNTAQNILAELSKLQIELGEIERMRGTNKTEVKKIEERLRSLGEEVIKKVSVYQCCVVKGKREGGGGKESEGRREGGREGKGGKGVCEREREGGISNITMLHSFHRDY